MRVIEYSKGSTRKHVTATIQQQVWRRLNVPYFILYHPASGRAASYNRHYEILSEDVSPKLRTFALWCNRYWKIDQFSFSYPEQRPSWLTPDEDQRIWLQFLYCDRDITDLEYLSRIPLK